MRARPEQHGEDELPRLRKVLRRAPQSEAAETALVVRIRLKVHEVRIHGAVEPDPDLGGGIDFLGIRSRKHRGHLGPIGGQRDTGPSKENALWPRAFRLYKTPKMLQPRRQHGVIFLGEIVRHGRNLHTRWKTHHVDWLARPVHVDPLRQVDREAGTRFEAAGIAAGTSRAASKSRHLGTLG